MAAPHKLSAVTLSGDRHITVHLATTSEVKTRQYASIFRDLGVDLVRAPMIASTFVEPQADPNLPDSDLIVVAHPLRQAARFAERLNFLPYMKEDTMLTIAAFSEAESNGPGLPGPDTKNWWRNLKAEGVLDLLRDKSERSARFTCHIGAYVGKGQYCFAQARLGGRISSSVRVSEIAKRDFPRSNPFFFHMIFEPLGSEKTLAEMGAEEFARHDYRRVCAKDFVAKLREFTLSGTRQLLLPLDVS